MAAVIVGVAFVTAPSLERGKAPAVLSVAMSAALAVITAARFAILVRALPPADYGRINIYATLVNVAPFFMNLGLSWQYQRLALQSGHRARRPLIRTAILVTLATFAPSFVAVLLVAAPIAGRDGFVIPAICATVIAAATGITSLYSQIAVGYGYRTRASLQMFLVNAAGLTPLIPMLVNEGFTVSFVLAWWAAGAVLAALIARLILPLRSLREHTLTEEHLSYAEGLLTLPAQVGPWLLIFTIRYLIGIIVGAEALAEFAIASTIADIGFAITVPLIGFYSNKLMTGHIPAWRVLLITAPMLLGLSAAGYLAVSVILPVIAQKGYSASLSLTALLAGVSLVRLHLAAWRPRAVGLRLVQRTSWAYLLIIPLSVVWVLWLRPVELAAYGWVMMLGFTLLAAVQRFAVAMATRQR